MMYSNEESALTRQIRRDDLDGSCNAIFGANVLRQTLGAGGIVWLAAQCHKCLCERLDRDLLKRQHTGRNAELHSALCPIGLVAKKWADQHRDTSLEGGGGCACAAMMHRCRDPLKQPILWAGFEIKHMRRGLAGIIGHPLPNDAAHIGPLQGFDHQRMGFVGIGQGHTAKADVDGRRPGG